jgi:hypothetical protein
MGRRWGIGPKAMGATPSDAYPSVCERGEGGTVPHDGGKIYFSTHAFCSDFNLSISPSKSKE